MKFIGILLTMALAACSTSHKEKSEVKELDTKIENSQDVNGETLGEKDDHIVIQKKRVLAEELRELQNYVYGVEAEVYGNRQFGSKGLYGVYRECSTELNASEYGGTGDVPYLEPAEKVIEEKEEFNFGKDENNQLVTVSQEYISERLERFKKYRDKLEVRRAEYELKVRVCNTKLKSAKKKVEKQES